MNNVQRMNEINEQMRLLREEYRTVAKAAFAEKSRYFFDNNPKLRCFGWTQFTPYFNDGDPCEFRVNSDVFINFPLPGDEDYGEHEPYEYERGYGYEDNPEDAWMEPLYDEIGEFLNSIDEDVMLDMFGDHAQIIVTRDGVEVEYYEHD